MSANDKINLSASEEATYRKLMATYPAKPLKAFWTAMRLKHSRGPSVALAIACNKDYCGLERRSTKADGEMDGPRIFYDGGATPLILAAQADRLDVMQGLVAAGADVNAQDDIGGYSALTVAAANENLATTQFLIAAGAVASHRDNYGRNPMYLVTYGETTGVIKLLIAAGVKLQSVDKKGRTVLHEAAQLCGSTIHIHFLLSEGASVSKCDVDGEAPLHKMRSLEVTKMLLNAGADIEAVNKRGETPLHKAAQTVDPDLIFCLVAAGASITAQDNKGRTPLQALNPKIGSYGSVDAEAIQARIKKLLSLKAQATKGANDLNQKATTPHPHKR